MEELVKGRGGRRYHRSVVEHRGVKRDHGWCSLSSLFYLGDICSMINSSVSQVCQAENMTYLMHRVCKAGIHACISCVKREWRWYFFRGKNCWRNRNWERLIVNLQEIYQCFFSFFFFYDEGVDISSRWFLTLLTLLFYTPRELSLKLANFNAITAESCEIIVIILHGRFVLLYIYIKSRDFMKQYH